MTSKSSAAEAPAPANTTTISLSEVADRYLNLYQKLFDMVTFCIASFRKISEEDYDQVASQMVVMPKNNARLPFDKAKDATETWILRSTLSEGLSTIVPLMEDARTICELCNYKASKKNDPQVLQDITTRQRQEFINLTIPEKFAYLEKNYGITSEVKDHILALMEVTKALVMKEGIVTKEEGGEKGEIRLKIRSVTIVQAPGQAQEGGSEPILSLTRKMADNERVLKVGDKIEFSKAEQTGSIITLAVFLASMLQGVQAYARKVGAAD